MELLTQVTNTQILFPAAAVAVVLICAALVFIFGFHSAEQPQFDKLPLVLDDKKSSSKKRKTKEKKSSPNRSANEDGKTKSETKKSPAKEKKEEKVKEEKPKAKNEVKPKKEEKKPLKKKTVESEKPSDFDEGVWEEVPKKSEKKKVKNPEEKKEHDKKENDKKESPKGKKKEVIKPKKVVEEVPAEAEAEPEVETIKVVSAVGPDIDEEAQRALQAQVEEVQRILREAERREKEALGSYGMEDETGDAKLTDLKDPRGNKKQENKEKQKKKSEVNSAKKQDSVENISENENSVDDTKNGAVFDELGDTWTEAKVAKKGKKKVRKDQ